MANLFFHGYKDFQRGKLCRTETLEQKIPINIEASGGSDFSLQENEICSIDLFGKDSELRIYPSEKDFRESEQEVTPYSLFPIGTMDETPDGRHVEETPFIVFSGRVIQVKPHPDGDENADYTVTVRTNDLVFDMEIAYKKPVEEGYWIMGITWLYGTVRRKEA